MFVFRYVIFYSLAHSICGYSFKKLYKVQTRKGVIFVVVVVAFLLSVVQGFKESSIPCDLEVLASEIFS